MKKFIFLIAIISVGLGACDDRVVFEQNVEIEGASWSYDQPVEFQFNAKDSVTLHNFYVNLRNGAEYPYSNIFLFVTINFPNGKKAVDTLECTLADASGQWLGRGMGSIYDNRFLYKERKQFALPGTYRVKINQAMRTDTLDGIYDVGFRLSRSY